MPAYPGRAALGTVTEEVIKRPFAIKAKRLKKRLPPGSHDEFRRGRSRIFYPLQLSWCVVLPSASARKCYLAALWLCVGSNFARLAK
jgi:hypothetical protein